MLVTRLLLSLVLALLLLGGAPDLTYAEQGPPNPDQFGDWGKILGTTGFSLNFAEAPNGPAPTAGKHWIATVISITPGSPAEKNGLQKGDQVTVINGIAFSGLNKEQVYDALVGRTGENVHLDIVRDGKPTVIEFARIDGRYSGDNRVLETIGPFVLIPESLEGHIFTSEMSGSRAGVKAIAEARELTKRHDLLAALAKYKKAIAASQAQYGPEKNYLRNVAMCGVADCYARDGNFEHAKLWLAHASDSMMSHDAWKPSLMLGDLFVAQKKYDEAIAQYQKTLDLVGKPISAPATEVGYLHNRLGDIYCLRNQFDDAEREYNTAEKAYLAVEPDECPPLYGMAYCYIKQGKLAEADAVYEKMQTAWSKHDPPLDAGVAGVARYRTFLATALGNNKLVETLSNQHKTSAVAAVFLEEAAPEAVDYHKYMQRLQWAIKSHWKPPIDVNQKPMTKTEEAVVRFKVDKKGAVSDVKIYISGGAKFDEAAIKAVNDSAPFGPTPKGASPKTPIQFTFTNNTHGNPEFRQF